MSWLWRQTSSHSSSEISATRMRLLSMLGQPYIREPLPMDEDPMDVALVAHQMRLDAFALRVSRALSGAGVEHLLLKGPTTARWLYLPPRLYRDVDMLVPPARLQEAVSVLAEVGLATSRAGVAGEEASHAQLLVSGDGIELDLHITLPLLPALTRRDVDVLWRHVEPFDVMDAAVPALDGAGRCVVVALHALSAPEDSQAVEDLRRAKGVTKPELWSAAAALAADLGARSLWDASLAVAEGTHDEAGLPVQVRLLRQGAAGAYQLERLLEQPLRSLPLLAWREAFPSPNFMRHSAYLPHAGPWQLLCMYVRRLFRLGRDLPIQLLILIRERRRSS